MTIIIAGHMRIDAAIRAAALDEGRPLIEGALTQPGCEAYAWALDPHDDEVIHVFERWTDTESLAAHFVGPWYRGMLGVLGAHGVRDADVSKYRVDLTEPVYDGTGTPRADFSTAAG